MTDSSDYCACPLLSTQRDPNQRRVLVRRAQGALEFARDRCRLGALPRERLEHPIISFRPPALCLLLWHHHLSD
jgi:hypothetical protein